MEFKAVNNTEDSGMRRIHHDFWPLEGIDPAKGRFPCCIVWTPLPIVSWLAPFIGHIGICQENGSILDFAGSNLVRVDSFTFGQVARFLQLEREKCCLPSNIASHTFNNNYTHSENRTAITWDDALHSSAQHFHDKFYNLFTCNSYSFVTNCLNRLCYSGSMDWNIISVATMVLMKGTWVDFMSVVRSFSPFTLVVLFGIFMAGWPFLIGLGFISFLLVVWFFIGTYILKDIIEL